MRPLAPPVPFPFCCAFRGRETRSFLFHIQGRPLVRKRALSPPRASPFLPIEHGALVHAGPLFFFHGKVVLFPEEVKLPPVSFPSLPWPKEISPLHHGRVLPSLLDGKDGFFLLGIVPPLRRLP